MKTDELREKYLAFFESKGCVRRPSDVLVPRWDPSVLFTPAGMNQFKDHFLGKVKLDFTRATTCQKCLRTGDIENVGRTAYHHTFFEMLGNFSFGDYFKREAINWGWEFLTRPEWLGLDAERLFVSVYVDDDEAAEIWARDIKLTPDRIKRMGEDDNFWPAGAPARGPTACAGRAAKSFTSRTPTARSRSGTWCSRSSIAWACRRTTCGRCPARTSTPAWGWSARPRCCRTPAAIFTSTSCCRSSRAPATSAD